MNKPSIKIDIVSDVVCPWCYIGKRRLEKALDTLSDRYEFILEYHPFELNPDMPLQGANQHEYLGRKFGSKARYDQITKQVSQVAAQEGIAFHFEKQHVSPNTRNAHRVIGLAREEGKQLQVVEAFFKAYFTDGVDLSQNENIVSVAVKAGLDEDKTRKLLSGDVGLTQVASAEKEMQQMGITGVPFYIINNTYGISGAQPAEAFIQAFEKIGSEIPVHGDSCDIDGSNC